MKKLFILSPIVVLIFLNCDLFFTAPYSHDFHKENEIDGYSTGIYLSEKFSSLYSNNLDYDFDYYYYVLLTGMDIAIYSLNENYEIIEAVKGSYELEYKYYRTYIGTIDINFIYDDSSEIFIESEYNSNITLRTSYVTVSPEHFSLYMSDFYDKNIYITIYKIENELEISPAL